MLIMFRCGVLNTSMNMNNYVFSPKEEEEEYVLLCIYACFLNMNSDSGACSKEMGLILWSRISTSANFRWMAVVMQRELQHEGFLNSQIYKFTIIFGKRTGIV